MNKPKIKGTWAETLVTRFCQERGFPGAERRALAGAGDRGDIALCPGVILEVKNHASPKLGGWMRETETERVNAGAKYGILVVKPPGFGAVRIPQWWAMVPAWQANELLRDAQSPEGLRIPCSGAKINKLPGYMAELRQFHGMTLLGEPTLPELFDFVVISPRGVPDVRYWHMVTHLDRALALLVTAGYGGGGSVAGADEGAGGGPHLWGGEPGGVPVDFTP